ncbi:cation channel sperm-associated protein 1 [Sceloporus undulatus]|uniref:cation channel sperm-associated protein 1 n=1 Tax=Sceloporus undulatus TaxID=8520 RepID=UPI001C4BADF3|nr:cation channel sperm-associated protein 1 [Sceloporus undulatus]
MDYLTVPTMPSLPQVEKSATKEETASASNLGGPGPSLGQASGMSLVIPPSQEPSTLMAATSVVMPSQTRSKEFRRQSRSPKSRRGSKGTHSSIRTKGGNKSARYHAKRKRRRRHMSLKVLVYRYWYRAHPYLVTLRKIIYDLTQSVFFDVFICTVVAVNITMLVAQTFAKIEIRGEWFFSAMDPAFLSVYVVEAILKIIALDFEYFHDPWNNIDFFIMIMTVLDFVLPLFISSRQGNRDNTVALFRVLKICKGIRAIRAIRFLLTLRVMENLQEITSTFILSSQSIGAIILLMFSFLFMSSVVLRDMFHDADEKHFGDLFKTIFTLFQLFTLDDWSIIYITCYDAGAWYIIIFLIIYILVEYFLLLNLVIAVLVDNFQMALLKRHELKKQKKVIEVEGITAEDDHSAKMTEIPKIKEEHEEEFFRRTLMDKYGSLELIDSEWQLLYSYFQLMTAIETNQQQFRSQASTTDKILDTFFETAEDDYIPR